MSNKKNSQDSTDFNFIFDNNIDQQSVDLKMKQIRFRNQLIIAFVIILIIGSVFAQSFFNKSNQDYIGGNILKISAGATTPQDEYSLANPWKDASFMGSLMYLPLFLTDGTFTEILPALANEHTVSPDGLTYTVTLEENLKWSDGHDLTIDDVIFSLEAFLLCPDVNGNISTAFNKIVGADDWKEGKSSSLEGVSADGNVLTINLSSKYNGFAMMLTQFTPLPKHILQDEDPATLTAKHEFFVNENPVSSGRFMSEGLDEDKNIVLVQNPYYHREQTDIEQVIAYWDWQNMEIDYYSTNNITQMVTFRSLKNYTEYPVDVFFYRYFVFNTSGSDAVDDVKVRQAVNHAIDIEKLFIDLYRSAGSLVYSGASAIDEEVYEYNPEKAKQLLLDANYDFSHVFKIAYYYSDATSRIFLQNVAEYLQAIGMKVELQRLSSAELYTDPTYDMMLKGLSAFDSADWYNEYLSTNSNMSALLGKDGKFDDLVDSMTSAVSTEDFRSYIRELVALEQELLFKLPLFTLGQGTYINTNRVNIPDDIVFGNTRYQSSLQLDKWSIKKS